FCSKSQDKGAAAGAGGGAVDPAFAVVYNNARLQAHKKSCRPAGVEREPSCRRGWITSFQSRVARTSPGERLPSLVSGGGDARERTSGAGFVPQLRSSRG